MNACKKCSGLFSNWVKINGKLRNVSSRKFCLTCSPFGKHNTKDLSKKSISIKCVCKMCQKIYVYKRSRGDNLNLCSSCRNYQRRRLIKRKLVELKGGKCRYCGYKKCLDALHFHHKRSDKKFNFGGSYNRSWSTMVAEVKKCDLVCANCHAELHTKTKLGDSSNGEDATLTK